MGTGISNHLKKIRRTALFLSMTTIAVFGRAEVVSDSTRAEHYDGGGIKGLYGRIKNYFDHTNDTVIGYKNFDWSIIGGPYYSSDVKFAIGLVASAQYRTSLADSVMQPSVASVKAQVSTTLFYSFGLTGTHIFPQDRQRINYSIKFQSLPTYFWGIGYVNGRDDIKSKYKELSITGSIEFLRRVGKHFFIGPTAEIKWINTRDRRGNEQLWTGEPLSFVSKGIGIHAELDTRDYITAPEKGWFISLAQKFYPRFLTNGENSFSSTEIEASHYKRVWHGGVLAGRLHGVFTYGHTPWGLMPTFGDIGMRGYYYGRYRDKCEADITLELRQHIWRRNGIVVWAGVGTVAPELSGLRWKHLLPNYGIGYRWEFKRHVNVRIDFGVGRGTTGFEFNINEVF